MLKTQAERRSDQAKDRREKKKQESPQPSKRATKEHPVQAIQESSDVDDHPDTDSEDESIPCAVTYQIHRLGVPNPEDQVRCDVDMNGDTYECIGDSGSLYSMCSKFTADKLQLTSTPEVRNFKGLGRLPAWRAAPITAIMHPHMKKHDIKFFVVDQEGFETIIGNIDLVPFGVVPDPELQKGCSTRSIRCISTTSTYNGKRGNSIWHRRIAI